MNSRTASNIVGMSFVLLLFVGLACAQEPANCLPNASFEQQKDGKLADWQTAKWAGEGVFEYANVGHTGQHSVMIASEKGGDIGWSATVAVEPYARYRLSGWIKTQDVQAKSGRGALLNIHILQPVATRVIRMADGGILSDERNANPTPVDQLK